MAQKRGAKKKTYSRIEEAEDLIKQLYEKHPDELWAVKPDNIVVYGVENKERPESNNTLAKVKAIKGVEKAIMQDYNIPVQYVVEIYWSDWNAWKEEVKQWILFHELQHVSPDEDKIVKHDCEDFKIILDVAGLNWIKNHDKLPNLLQDDVKFDLSLRPNLVEYCEDNEIKSDSEDDEIE